jgi:hypothetical protein
MPTSSNARETYRLILTRRSAGEILLLPNGKDWMLPRAEIQKQQRVAEQLTAETEKAWGLRTYCLFTRGSRSCGNEEPACAVLECAKHNEKAPAGAYWMSLAVAGECCSGEEACAIREALAELASYRSGERHGPFAKPGWLKELFGWVHEQAALLGIRLTGNFVQWNASPTFSLLRLETDEGALWFKAAGEPNAHELPITLLLARLFPAYLPRILGVHREWNGWLAAEAAGTPLDEIAECAAWEQAAEELANLQVASIGRSVELLDGQCRDLRLSGAESSIDPFLSRMGEFMRAQQKDSPGPLSAAELASLGEGLKESFALLRSFGLPDTLGHLDCNPGNLLVSEDKCVFLDWAEASVTNPLVTFEYLRRHMARCRIEEPAAEARVTAAYLRPWNALFPPEVLGRAVAAVPPVAVFVHAIGSGLWRTVDPAANPALGGYFRSLARRMYRDAVLAAERSERCLS